MQMATRQRREYLKFLDAARVAAEAAIDAFNSPWHRYRFEATLLLLSNGWELFAKAVLLARKEPITRGQRGETISAEEAVRRLEAKALLDANQTATIQQVISLRNYACHGVLPEVPPEVMQHLLFYSCKFFRDLLTKEFPNQVKHLPDHYLTLSFADLTTYADKVQKAVAKVKKSGNDKRLVWLLERGIAFDGSSYLTEAQFEQKYRGKKRVLPHLSLSQFIRNADMVRVVAVQAPRNYTADITLRKGSAADASLPVLIKKTDVEADYPHLTKELATQIGKSQNWTAKAIAVLGLKNDSKYHQAIRASSSSTIQRYSGAALAALKARLAAEPAFNPYA
jgi:hypothetical protein